MRRVAAGDVIGAFGVLWLVLFWGLIAVPLVWVIVEWLIGPAGGATAP